MGVAGSLLRIGGVSTTAGESPLTQHTVWWQLMDPGAWVEVGQPLPTLILILSKQSQGSMGQQAEPRRASAHFEPCVLFPAT